MAKKKKRAVAKKGVKRKLKESRKGGRDDEDGVPQSIRSLRSGFSRLVESVYTGTNPDAGTEFDDRFYRSLDTASSLDLPAGFLQAAQRLSLLLYRKNVRAYRSVELIKDFVLGDGINISAADERVEDLLRQQWEVNEWEEKASERLRSLALFGEQLWPVFIAKDGIVTLASVSPLRIIKAVCNAENAERIEAVVARLDQKAKTFSVIRKGENLGKNPAFYFAVNRIAGGARGTPDMLSAIDWLEGLDNMAFGLLERSQLAQDVVFDLAYTGAGRKEIRENVREFISMLRAGGVYGHNEKAELNIKSPNLGATESETAIRIMLRQIQSGTGLAGLFYGDSDDLTRASASELSVPVAKMIQGRQEVFKRMLKAVFSLQIEQTRAAGGLKDVTDFTFEVQMPKVFLRDLTTLTSALVQLSTALRDATDEGWVSNANAGSIFRSALAQMGTVSDDVEELPVSETTTQYRKVLSEHWEKKDESGDASRSDAG